MKSANLLAIIYQKENKWKDYAEMRDLEIKMQGIINNEEAQKSMTKLKSRFEFEKEQIRKRKRS